MRQIRITLMQLQDGRVIAQVTVEPPITWQERDTTEIERVAKAMLDKAVEYKAEVTNVAVLR